MQIDFAKLLGFDTVSDEISNGLDFKGETFGGKLGAKVGTEDTPVQKRTIEFSKLLGFDIATNELSKSLDLQDETLSAKLGAKIGPPEITSPSRTIDFQDDTLGARLGAKVGDLESTPSDARLKRDITQIATRDDGLQIYSFRYLWDDEVRVGVMAQDLLRNEAWAPAVVTKEGGDLFVDYALLGLRMTTLDKWQAKGMAALTR